MKTMIEEHLEKIRKDYIKVEPPSYLVRIWTLRKGLALVSFALLVSVVTVFGVAQAAKPKDPLYPVKILSENLVAKVTGDYEIKVERRAQELIDLSSQSPQNLDEATRLYQETLDKAEKEAQKVGRGQEFRQTLDQQEEKLREAQRANPAAQQQLENAIWHIQQAKGDVQGEKDQGNPQDQNNPGKSNSNP
ncbi:hypothetical protein HYW39_00620 [Candidatus Curtissbacteria bacterium]|nr:hypothetical protein [Candidatus Curtissbacteria bacterium]